MRSRPVARPRVPACALLLGYFGGLRGGRVVDTFWTRALDLAPARLHDPAQEASHRGLLAYRNAGGTVEVTFDAVLNAEICFDRAVATTYIFQSVV